MLMFLSYDADDFLDIHKYFMKKNKIKYCLSLLRKHSLDYKVLVQQEVTMDH